METSGQKNHHTEAKATSTQERQRDKAEDEDGKADPEMRHRGSILQDGVGYANDATLLVETDTIEKLWGECETAI